MDINGSYMDEVFSLGGDELYYFYCNYFLVTPFFNDTLWCPELNDNI